MSTWTNDATRTTDNSRESTANRSIVCFEVLDYDSLTHVVVNGEYTSVCALIYKKVTISHQQHRKYTLSHSTPEANNKDTKLPTMPVWYLDSVPATDNFSYNGTRTVEYKLALVVGNQQYLLSLGTITITNSGHYNLSGKNIDLIEGAANIDSLGPIISVTGNRLYGVSINCGKDLITYTYDAEELDPSKSFSNNVMFQTDSPINAEDYNDYWIKKNRVVGAMNYYGKSDSKEFPYTKFPDKVMAVCYKVSQ